MIRWTWVKIMGAVIAAGVLLSACILVQMPGRVVECNMPEAPVIIVDAPPPPPAPLPLPPTQCPWRFKEYISSPYELEWEQNIGAWQERVCARMSDPDQIGKGDRWAEYVVALNQNDRGILGTNTTIDQINEILSRFVYERECDNATRLIYIEPIAGLTRHPYFCTRSRDLVVDKSYMLVDWAAAEYAKDAGEHAEHYYFDAGASSYTAGAGGASQGWIVDTYASRSIQFDDILAWEYTPMGAADIFAQIPAAVKPHYHWYNIPVSAVPAHPDNPITNIEALCRQNDFVVFKIDIDTPSLEEPIVYELLNNTHALSLVDEMFFEHHVDIPEMYPYWGGGMAARLSDSYALFLRYRRAGVRIHSWV